MVAEGWGRIGDRGLIVNGCGVSFSGYENVLKLTLVMVVHIYEYTKNQ